MSAADNTVYVCACCAHWWMEGILKIYGGLSGFPWGNPAAVDQTKGGLDRGTHGGGDT